MLVFSDKMIDIPNEKKVAIFRVNAGHISPYMRSKHVVWDLRAKSVSEDNDMGLFGMRADYVSVGFDFHFRLLFSVMPVDAEPTILLMEANRDDLIKDSILEVSFRKANIIKVFNIVEFGIFSAFTPELSHILPLYGQCKPLREMFQNSQYNEWVVGMMDNLDSMFERLSNQFPEKYIANLKPRYKEAAQKRFMNVLQEVLYYKNQIANL